jgi:hypothetical protein
VDYEAGRLRFKWLHGGETSLLYDVVPKHAREIEQEVAKVEA